MDIFKLFFNHDQRLDKLAKRNANKTKEEVEATLADFMKPDPTYSKFYLTGTKIAEEEFGLNILDHYPDIMQKLSKTFEEHRALTSSAGFEDFAEAVQSSEIGQAIVLTTREMAKELNLGELNVDEESNVGHFKEELSHVLEAGHIVVYKEQAHNGFDLHFFTRDNIYDDLFYPLKELVETSEAFRFFSINGKRMRSEKHFYFETWTLDKPPHGAEEVFPETVL